MNLIPRQSLFDSFFDSDFPRYRLLPENRSEDALAVDIEETDKGYRLKADFPGLKKDDISVSVENNVLTLSAEYSEEREEKDKGRILRQERRFGRYSRSFSLGNDVDESKIKASFDAGVLTLDIPRAESKQPKKKAIPVQ